MDLFIHILGKETFLVYLIGVMVMVGIIKELKLFHLQFLSKIKDKRLAVVTFSALAGILPVPGRVTISAGLLDTIATKDPEKKKAFGVLDYLATHHFYFWSPLEKTVILPLAALGVSYGVWISYFWIPLVLYILFLIWYIYTQVDEDSIELHFADKFNLKEFLVGTAPVFIGIVVAIFINPSIVFGALAIYYTGFLIKRTGLSGKELLIKLNDYINWKLVLLLAILLPIDVIAVNYGEQFNIKEILGSTTGLIVAAFSIFMITLLTGEEDLYAALNAVVLPIVGIQYLPIMWFAGYYAYSLSPLHKCIWISTGYFGTPVQQYYSTIIKLLIVLSIYTVGYSIYVF